MLSLTLASISICLRKLGGSPRCELDICFQLGRFKADVETGREVGGVAVAVGGYYFGRGFGKRIG
jgi:hypothetical protein